MSAVANLLKFCNGVSCSKLNLFKDNNYKQ
jgi:hypothetical protein